MIPNYKRLTNRGLLLEGSRRNDVALSGIPAEVRKPICVSAVLGPGPLYNIVEIMTPILYSLAGPLKGTSTPLTDEGLTIGRDRSNQVAIADLHLSRHHCRINKEGLNCKIVDLDSRNGVFVNSIPARERILNHGDRIKLGSSLFVFVSEQEEPFIETILTEEELSTGSFVTTRSDQIPGSIQELKELDVLLRISASISCIQNLESLGRTLLDLVLEVVPAQRGAILILESHSNAFITITRRTKAPNLPPARINLNMTEQVVKQRLAVLAKDVRHDESMIPSVLCAPFVLFDRVFGILYADTLDAMTPLNENHLQLVNAIAAISAPIVKNCIDMEECIERRKRLQTELHMDRPILGESPEMKKIIELIVKISGSDTTVLICGETGSGKELAARAIHANSHRANNSFVAINCAALPDTLLESELFGYEKGAFTGAIAQKKGKLELAAGGTLFLDEIGELAPILQVKLLRFLQEREFERLGGTRTIQVDLRLVAATNKNLKKEVDQGKFRQDLYYRLNVVQLEMPPLRELDDDILLLTNYFVSRLSRKLGRRVHGVSPEAQQCLMQYDWPGNVRELENVLERAILLGSTEVILSEDLPDSLLCLIRPGKEDSTDFHRAVNEYKRKLIRKALDAAGNNYTVAAASLGIHSAHLYRLVKNLRLDPGVKK